MKNYNEDTLFGKKVISTISYDEQEIIRDILLLHADGKSIDCDPTYSIGNFYKNGIKQPKYKFDKFPQTAGVAEATSDNLPLQKESCDVIMFDPPFVMGGVAYNQADDGSCIISKRFTQFESFDELKTMYSRSLLEFSRILRQNGIVIFKCQDCVFNSKQHFSHVWVMNQAIATGFYPKDMFVLVAKNRINDGRVQQHARKYHSYFWVFKKQQCKVDYSLF